MGSMVSGLADAVLGVVQGVGLSSDTVARYGKCCEAVVEFCDRRGFDALSGQRCRRVHRVPAERAWHGEIGRNRRNALVKTARMILEFQRTGRVTWRMMSPGPGLSGASEKFSNSSPQRLCQEVAPGSARVLAGESAISWPISTGPPRSRRGHRGRRPGVHGRDGTQAARRHRQRGVVAQEVLRLPQHRRAQ